MGKHEPPQEAVSAAIYVRVSTDEQVQEGFSLETQVPQVREELYREYGENLYETVVYPDEGYPGWYGICDPDNSHSKCRPGLTAMQQAFKEGRHQILGIYSDDRLWRGGSVVEFLEKHFVPYGLRDVVCVRGEIDLTSPSGRFSADVKSAASRLETEVLGQRVSDGLQQRRRDGFAHKPPYGWRWQEAQERPPDQRRPGIARDEEQGEHLLWMVKQYLAGKGIRSITQELNDRRVPTPRGGRWWGRPSVKHVLANCVHAGLVETESGQYVEGQHFEQRYYEAEVFYQIKARMERNAKLHPRRANVPEYLLGGVLRCGHCGYKLSCRRVNRDNRRYYRCYTGQHRGKTVCTRNSKQADLVERAVLSRIRVIASDPETARVSEEMLEELVAQTEQQLEHDLARLEKQLEEVWGQYEFWSEKYYQGEIDHAEFEFHRQRLLERRKDLGQRLDETRTTLDARQQRQAELRQAREVLKDFDETFDGLTLEQQREMVHLLVEDAQMFHQEDGSTRVVFSIRCNGQFERVIPRLRGRGSRGKGPESLTMREMEIYKLLGEGMDRGQVAKELGIQLASVRVMLCNARKKLAAADDDEAYEIAKNEIQVNADWLFTGRRRRRRPIDPNKPPLTPRQAEILALKAEGLKADEIAERLGIAANTVYVQLDNCRHRLGRNTTEHAIRHAKQMGYI